MAANTNAREEVKQSKCLACGVYVVCTSWSEHLKPINEKEDKMKNIVIYHKNCLDGTCAAWVASKYLKEEDTEYIAVKYGEALKDQMELRDKSYEFDKEPILYILDWCPEMQDLDDCCNSFKQVILIDHHESAINKLKEHYGWDKLEEAMSGYPKNLEMFLAQKNEWSGAMGTAIWFANKDNNEDARFIHDNFVDHWLVKAVDDRDRWQFKLSFTKEINEGLFFLGFDLNEWKNRYFNEDHYGQLVDQGKLLIENKKRQVEAIISSAAIVDDNTEKIIFCNCPYYLASEVGNVLAKDYRMAVLWFMDSEGQISVSLRSNSDTKDWINCAKIAEQFKGGGHANAAGFELNFSFEEMATALNNAVIDTEQNLTDCPF